jgi:hypothetical protein
MIISKATQALSWITKAIFFGWKIQVRDNDPECCGCFASVEGQFLATDAKFTLEEQRLSGWAKSEPNPISQNLSVFKNRFT